MDTRRGTLTLRGHSFAWGERTYIMGILNVTPDSFSGDGLGTDIAAAVALAQTMQADGANILDLGAESSRPGAPELDPSEELRRLLPALEAVRAITDLPISVDTYHPSVADAALATGADMVNDIFGLLRDAEMAHVVQRHGAALVAMHNQRGRDPGDVVECVRAGFDTTLNIAHDYGIPRNHVILDPGFGFGWTPEQNLEMVRRLAEMRVAGMPLLIGPSRKSTIGFVLDAPVEERLEGTAAAVAIAIANGADIIRVHDVREMVRVARVADAISRDNWRHQPKES